MTNNNRLEVYSPYKISGSGWKNILKRVKNEMGTDNLHIIAAGVAFYTFLAIFPAIIAIISIYGLVVDPTQVQQQIQQLSGIVPQEAFSVIEKRITNISQSSSSTLGWSSVLSLLFTLWSANTGMKALFTGIGIAYNEEEQRSFIKQNVISLLFTLGSMIVIIICMAFVVAFPALAHSLPFKEQIINLISWLRWPVLALVVFGWFCLMYKYAPASIRFPFKWVSIGALFSTVMWILGSLAFSFYVNNFGNYNETYGSISAVVILLFWLFITNFIISIGAEIISEAAEEVPEAKQ